MPNPNQFDWTQVDWEDLYLRLLIVAVGKLNRLTWRGARFGSVPGGKTPHDFVQEAIKKTLEGKRVWDQTTSLYDHLVGVISSEIHHLATSSENRTTVQSDERVIYIEDRRISPETLAVRKAQLEHYLAYLEAKAPRLCELARLILNEPVRDAPGLAIKLNLSIRTLDRLKRALRRATQNYIDAEEALDKRAPNKAKGANDD